MRAALAEDDEKAFTRALDDLTRAFKAIRGSKVPPPPGADQVAAVPTPDHINELILRKIEPKLRPPPSRSEQAWWKLRRK